MGAQNVLEQAQRYARGLTDSPFDFNGYRVPFIYSTNGEQIYFQDLHEPQSRSRQVKHFHTPNALREMLARDEPGARTWLAAHPIAHLLLRPYQRDAIANVEDALAQGRRKMLAAMATGTGKTLTAIALLHRLMEARFARRI